jgi:hypothetical protein
MKKKVFLAGALIVLMAVGAFAQTYTAESNFEVTKTATAVTITRYVGGQSISTVNIPPTIQNLPVTAIGSGAFSNNWSTSITIPASVTSIDMTALYALPSLTTVTFLGTIPRSGLNNITAFPGDLVAKFYATDRNNGTPGTYTRSREIWTLTPAATPASASAQNSQNDFDWYETADKRGIIIEGYIGRREAGAVRIPDRINNLPVVEIGGSAFHVSRGLITSVVIPNTVTKIGDRAFFMQQNLTSVTLPTSLVEIELNAFQDCTALTSISLPASIRTIGGGVFRNCTALTTVTIPTSVTRITFGTNVFTGATNVNAASKTALQRVGYTGNF